MYRDILVHIDNSAPCAQRLSVALKVAKAQKAHLTGLFLLPYAEIPRFMEVQISQEIVNQQRAAMAETAKEAKRDFAKACEDAGVTFSWQETPCSAAEIADTVAMYARHHDLTVLGQYDPDSADPSSTSEMPDKAILTAGTPVLVVPYAGRFETIGERVMVAWKPYREAVRAVNDGMAFLENAKSALVLCADPNKGARDSIPVPGVDIGSRLERHGVNVRKENMNASGISVGDLLLSRAADESIDLIVCGAYGRPRLRELMMGGVTQHLLRHMTVPVLMSH
ncbi:universal stress protein UspA [Thalassospira lucentensis]|uniref:Nucleotide-binding universal stress protein, UspA family n=2 Tax=Thalassospira TaxID=168934 RepID=A0A285RKD3_9PROT|nr:MULTISPECIES: universal stress protein [Thalassospira]KZB62969.1 universal stress protein UspA [Thalassospira lucentensis]MAZ34435.1 universal stress protein UspA [Thalassospira sp.]MBO9508377.1 universal stress protein [Thalassospira sp. A3_1]MCH2274764.1 universal stress protein [Thalassospira sp.]MCK2166009.1 universal stress protein [Thalassospira xiamenensis]